jgi:hypothetical protein
MESSIPETAGDDPDGFATSVQEVVYDTHANLVIFIRLTKAGHFVRARAFYDEVLASKAGEQALFPVIAEYADMLIDQGAFSDAELYLSDILTAQASMLESMALCDEPFRHTQVPPETLGISDDERMTLQLLLALTRIHTKYDNRAALELARTTLSRDRLGDRLNEILQYTDPKKVSQLPPLRTARYR